MKVLQQMPSKVRNDYWPGRLDSTIDDAVSWFKRRFGKAPELIVVESRAAYNRKAVFAAVRMWAKGIRY